MSQGVDYPKLKTRLARAQTAVVPVELKLAEEIRRVLRDVGLRGAEIDDDLATELSGRIKTPEQVHKYLTVGVQLDPTPLDLGIPIGSTYLGRLGINRGRRDHDIFQIQPNRLKGSSGLDRVMSVLGIREFRTLIRTFALIAIKDAVDFSNSDGSVARSYYMPREDDLFHACSEQVSGVDRIMSALSIFPDPRLVIGFPPKFQSC